MAISLVQKNKVTFATATTYVLAYGSNVTAGNTLLAVSYNNGANQTQSVTDTLGNTWTLVDTKQSFTTTNALVCFICQNCLGGANTVTLNPNNGSNSGDLLIFEYNGVAAGSLDTHNIQNGANTAPASGSITTTFANEMLFEYFATSGGSGVIDATFASQEDDGGFAIAGDRLVSTATSYSATNNAANAAWACGILSLKPTGSGTTSQPVICIMQ